MAFYNLLATEQTVHVLTTLDTIDAVRATIQSPVHQITAASIVPLDAWGTETGINQLRQVAFDVDWLIDNTPAIAGIGNQSIDANGLTQQVVTFTVAYSPPGSTNPPLTSTVDVPMPWLEEPIPANTGPSAGLQSAIDMIDAAEQALIKMAG